MEQVSDDEIAPVPTKSPEDDLEGDELAEHRLAEDLAEEARDLEDRRPCRPGDALRNSNH